jgi:hypothetical protein
MKPTIIVKRYTKVIIKKIYVYGCPKGYQTDPSGKCQPQGSG